MEPPRALVQLAVGFAVLLSATVASTASTASAQEASMGEYLEMEKQSEPYRAIADRFILAAAAGDTSAVIGMISPRLREQAGDIAVWNVVTTQVLPFFAGYSGTGKSVTITQTSDQFGNDGFAYYMWMEPKTETSEDEAAGDETAEGETVEDERTTEEQAAEPELRPFVVYVLQEGETLVVGNILVDHFVEGRHQ